MQSLTLRMIAAYQPWLASEDEEVVRQHLLALGDRQRSFRQYVGIAYRDVILGMPASLIAAFKGPLAYAIFATLFPAAACKLYERRATGTTHGIGWRLLGTLASVGAPKTLTGSSCLGFWEWLIGTVSLVIWRQLLTLAKVTDDAARATWRFLCSPHRHCRYRPRHRCRYYPRHCTHP